MLSELSAALAVVPENWGLCVELFTACAALGSSREEDLGALGFLTNAGTVPVQMTSPSMTPHWETWLSQSLALQSGLKEGD